jgi:hypothetical protein
VYPFAEDFASNKQFNFAEHWWFPFGVGIIAEKSASDNADGRLTLIKNGVNDRLNALGGADA